MKYFFQPLLVKTLEKDIRLSSLNANKFIFIKGFVRLIRSERAFYTCSTVLTYHEYCIRHSVCDTCHNVRWILKILVIQWVQNQELLS